MSLRNIRKDIDNLKKEMVIDDKPSMDNFIKFCERYCHRPVIPLCEIIFSEYRRYNADKEMVTYKSNLKLFCQLSVKYFEEIHNGKVGNPVKDSTSKYSLRRWVAGYWQEELQHNDEINRWNRSKILESKEFNDWFESYWSYLINSDDDIKGNVRITFEKFTGLKSELG